MHTPHRLYPSVLAAIALLAALACTSGAANAATVTWSNPAGGAWSDPANWTPAQVPDVGQSAVLPTLGAPYLVTLDLAPAVSSLDVQSGATLDLGARNLGGVGSVDNAGTLLGFAGAYGNQIHNHTGGVVHVAPMDSILAAGTIANDGTIIIGPGAGTALYLTSGVTFSGTGTLLLDTSPRVNCPLPRPQHSIILANAAGHTIIGSGDVWVPVSNQGTLVASDGNTLVLHQVFTNQGTVRVASGGRVNVDAPLTQNSGVIVGAGGTFSTMMPYDALGMVDNAGGGRFLVDGGDLTLTVLEINRGSFDSNGGGAVHINIGTLDNMVVSAGTEVVVDGAIDLMVSGSSLLNHGTVRVRGYLNVGGYATDSVSLAGDGTIVLDGGTLHTNADNGCTMINAAGHTIRGCGTIDAKLLNLGTIDVDCTGSLTPSAVSRITNRGLIQVHRGLFWMRESGAQLLNAGGSITAYGDNGGQVVVERGASIQNTGGVIAASGGQIKLGWHTSATIQGGVLTSSGAGAFTNYAQTTLQDVTLAAGASYVTADHATTHATGARFTNQGTNRVTGTGVFSTDAATDYVQSTGTTVLDGGTLSAPRGIQLGGALSGHGTVIAALTNAGEVSPDPTGTGITVQGDYRQLAAGRLSIGLAGNDALQFSRLAVTGAATLDGEMDVASVQGFAPAAGHAFDVLGCAARSGDFASCVGKDSSPPLGVVPIYGDAGVAVQVNSTTAVGDPLPTSLRFRAGETGFVLELPSAARVSVRIFDVQGRQVMSYAGSLSAGAHPLALRSVKGAVARGMYFARAQVWSDGRQVALTARRVVLD